MRFNDPNDHSAKSMPRLFLTRVVLKTKGSCLAASLASFLSMEVIHKVVVLGRHLKG